MRKYYANGADATLNSFAKNGCAGMAPLIDEAARPLCAFVFSL
jgi:hypothetical protein